MKMRRALGCSNTKALMTVVGGKIVHRTGMQAHGRKSHCGNRASSRCAADAARAQMDRPDRADRRLRAGQDDATRNGAAGWGEAPALKDWGGEFGRYFGESPGTTIEVITRYLAPAVQGLPAGRDRRAARAHGPRDQGLPLCQGGGRIRRL